MTSEEFWQAVHDEIVARRAKYPERALPPDMPCEDDTDDALARRWDETMKRFLG